MGQKVSPVGFRLAVRKRWKSVWFATKLEFGNLLSEDRAIRDFLYKKSTMNSASDLIIKRMSGKIEITIHTARPGLVIGKKGAGIEELKRELKVLLKKDVFIEIEEIKRPDLDAKLVAQNIASQLARRVSFRRAMKKAIQSTMDAGAQGVKVQVSGRVGGAEIARTEMYKEGRIPLHTLRAQIDYAYVRAETTYGSLGVKVWVNRLDEV